MSIASDTSTLQPVLFRLSGSYDPTPPEEKGIIMMPSAEPQVVDTIPSARFSADPHMIFTQMTDDTTDDTTLDSTLRLYPPPPQTYTNNYSSFATAFLTPLEIQQHWNNPPILVNNFNSETVPETQFLDAVGRVSVDEHFAAHIWKGSVIDFGLGNSEIRFFATCTQLMDNKVAYIRVVAHDRHGSRCDAAHPDFGNFILVIPRRLNDVVFPFHLRFHALHTTSGCYNLGHNRIRRAAWEGMTQLDEVIWKFGSFAIL
jgi:hypothetical protein